MCSLGSFIVSDRTHTGWSTKGSLGPPLWAVFKDGSSLGWCRRDSRGAFCPSSIVKPISFLSHFSLLPMSEPQSQVSGKKELWAHTFSSHQLQWKNTHFPAVSAGMGSRRPS